MEEPEKKRKIIGAEFIRVFEEEARKLEGIEFLAQGTIYPDILESDGVKAHHNVGGLPEDLKFSLVEPLRLRVQRRGPRRGYGARPAGQHGLPSAVPGPRTGRKMSGRHYQGPSGGSARI